MKFVVTYFVLAALACQIGSGMAEEEETEANPSEEEDTAKPDGELAELTDQQKTDAKVLGEALIRGLVADGKTSANPEKIDAAAMEKAMGKGLKILEAAAGDGGKAKGYRECEICLYLIM